MSSPRRNSLLVGTALALMMATAAHAQSSPTDASPTGSPAQANTGGPAPPATAGTPADATTSEAQEASSGLTDIIVTATRRATNVQDVPIAITAVGGAELQAQGITDSTALVRVAPNLFATSGYSPGNIRFAIRGLGSTDFSPAGGSPVGIYIDDVYQPYSFGIGSQVYDLDRVEVLRGPQGTLFGKNTTGGAVSYFSARPTSETGGYLNADGYVGNYRKVALEGAYNMPLSDNLAVRAGFRFEHRDPFVRNVLGGKLGESTIVSGRVQLEWKPSTNTIVNLKLFGMNSDGDATIYHPQFLTNVCQPANFDLANTPYAGCNGTSLPSTYPEQTRTASEVPIPEFYHNYGTTVRITQELGEWNITSISAYEKIIYETSTNDDGAATDYFHSTARLNGYTMSQELRVASPADKPLSAIIGAYGQYDRAIQPNFVASTLLGPPLDFLLRYDATQKDLTLAGFGSATLKLTDQFSIVGGVRYSWERKTVNYKSLEVFPATFGLAGYNLLGFPPAAPTLPIDPALDFAGYTQFLRRQSWSRVTWDGTVNYKPNADVLLYAKVAQGFKSGGFNLSSATPDAFTTVDPETVRDYEVGAKFELFDRHLRLNAAGFYYKFSDQQVLSTGSNGVGTFLSNAGRSTLKGFELEAEAVPVDGLRLTASFGYVDAKFDRFDTTFAGAPISLAGNRLPYAPEWTSTAGASYDLGLMNGYTLQAQTDWNYRSRVYFDPFNFDATGDRSRVLGNVRFTLTPPSKDWHIALYATNVTNQRYRNFGYLYGNVFAATTYADARLFGAQLGIRF